MGIIWKPTVEVTIHVFLVKIRKFVYRYCPGVPNVGMSACIELQKNLNNKIWNMKIDQYKAYIILYWAVRSWTGWYRPNTWWYRVCTARYRSHTRHTICTVTYGTGRLVNNVHTKTYRVALQTLLPMKPYREEVLSTISFGHLVHDNWMFQNKFYKGCFLTLMLQLLQRRKLNIWNSQKTPRFG